MTEVLIYKLKYEFGIILTRNKKQGGLIYLIYRFLYIIHIVLYRKYYLLYENIQLKISKVVISLTI